MTDIEWHDAILRVDQDLWSAAVLVEITENTARIARDIAPVRLRRSPLRPARSTRRRPRPGSPGKLKASVSTNIDRDGFGWYGDVFALWYGRFMDPPARQLHYIRPFLPTALFTAVAEFEAGLTHGAARDPVTGRFISSRR